MMHDYYVNLKPNNKRRPDDEVISAHIRRHTCDLRRIMSMSNRLRAIVFRPYVAECR